MFCTRIDDSEQVTGQHQHLKCLNWIVNGDRSMAVRVFIGAYGTGEKVLQAYPLGVRQLCVRERSLIFVEGGTHEFLAKSVLGVTAGVSNPFLDFLEGLKDRDIKIPPKKVRPCFLDYGGVDQVLGQAACLTKGFEIGFGFQSVATISHEEQSWARWLMAFGK